MASQFKPQALTARSSSTPNLGPRRAQAGKPARRPRSPNSSVKGPGREEGWTASSEPSEPFPFDDFQTEAADESTEPPTSTPSQKNAWTLYMRPATARSPHSAAEQPSPGAFSDLASSPEVMSFYDWAAPRSHIICSRLWTFDDFWNKKSKGTTGARAGVTQFEFAEQVKKMGFQGDGNAVFAAVARDPDKAAVTSPNSSVHISSTRSIRHTVFMPTLSLSQYKNFEARMAALRCFQTDEDTAAGVVLLRFLEQHFGCALRGWRLEIDQRGAGRVTHEDFVHGCRRLGVGWLGAAVWKTLSKDGMPLEFKAIAPQEGANLESFADILYRNFGYDFEQAWLGLDSQHQNFLTFGEFERSARKLGFEGNMELLFRGLDAAGTDRIPVPRNELVNYRRVYRGDVLYVCRMCWRSGRLGHGGDGVVPALAHWVEHEIGSAEAFANALGLKDGQAIQVGDLAAYLTAFGWDGDALEAASHLARSEPGTNRGVEVSVKTLVELLSGSNAEASSPSSKQTRRKERPFSSMVTREFNIHETGQGKSDANLRLRPAQREYFSDFSDKPVKKEILAKLARKRMEREARNQGGGRHDVKQAPFRNDLRFDLRSDVKSEVRQMELKYDPKLEFQRKKTGDLSGKQPDSPEVNGSDTARSALNFSVHVPAVDVPRLQADPKTYHSYVSLIQSTVARELGVKPEDIMVDLQSDGTALVTLVVPNQGREARAAEVASRLPRLATAITRKAETFEGLQPFLNKNSPLKASCSQIPDVVDNFGDPRYNWYKFEVLKLRGGGDPELANISNFTLRCNGMPVRTKTVQQLPLVLQPKAPQRIEEYCFTSGHENPGLQPLRWCLMGSRDAEHWDTLSLQGTDWDCPSRGPHMFVKQRVGPPEEKNLLRVLVVKAAGLRNVDIQCQGLSDPYVCVWLSNKPESRVFTKVIDDNLNPVWNERLEVRGYQEGDTLRFRCLDADFGTSMKNLRKDEWLGDTDLSPQEIGKWGFDGELALRGTNGQHWGTLTVKVRPFDADNLPVQVQGRKGAEDVWLGDAMHPNRL